MKNINVVAHTSFLGTTGYNSHSQNFFSKLNDIIPTRIRNYTYVKKFSEFEKQHLPLFIESKWPDPPNVIGFPFERDPNITYVDIVLNESHHYYFYDQYDHPMIAYNVWESTKQIPEFFNRLLDYDQFWCPTEWQKQCTIDQGYPEDKIRVVPEAVDGSIFYPNDSPENRKYLYDKYDLPDDAFTFCVFGRWDYRKAITEIIQCFNEEFKNDDKVYLILSADNPFSVDGLKSTEERLKKYKLQNERIKVLHFPERSEYIKWMQNGNVFLSCSRSEGWNLPLIEAIACGTPSICSNWSGQLEFADGIAHMVNVNEFKKPQQVFTIGDNKDIGVWGEPDFDHLKHVMRDVYDNYDFYKKRSISLSKHIRKIYTWENAARTATEYIEELETTQTVVPEIPELNVVENPVKLNLGCGNNIRKDYINIDRYNNVKNVDINCDFSQLSFRDNTIDEIYASHIFEHISIEDMYATILEWKRVLKNSGLLILRLPNLENEVRTWLNTPDEKKWFEVKRIFGSQTHIGNTHFCGFNEGSLKNFLERFDFYVKDIKTGNRGFGEEIQCTAINMPDKKIEKPSYVCHFVDGPFLEIRGDTRDKSFYQVEFIDPDNDSFVHQDTYTVNCWTRPHRKYFTNWYVRVRRNGILDCEHVFDLNGKNVLIHFNTKGLGDTIAWFPYIEEFRKKHKCNVFISTFWNSLFQDHEDYKSLNFIAPGSKVLELYASYEIGCEENDIQNCKNPINWKTVPLQKVCSDILGLDYKEIIPSIVVNINENNLIKEKYVTISEWSTFQCKHWNHPGGWQSIVNWFNDNGYKVAVISKENTNLKNIIDRTNSPIKETIATIYNSEMFLGVSSGLSWLAWALKKPVVLISGYSEDWAEFKSNVERIINKDVCHGCFNDQNYNLIKGDWNWCPRFKDTSRRFECSKSITPDMVKQAIERILK